MPIRSSSCCLFVFVMHAVLLVAMLAEQPLSAAAPRYAAMLANGQRLEGAKLADWHDIKAIPRLDSQPLMEPSNPLRWLRDRTQRLADLPAAFIEFHNGDRLPGVPSDYRTGLESNFEPLPPHLIVRSTQSFEPPQNKLVNEIRVLTPLIRRIVWQRRGPQNYQPGTAFYRDGRAIEFRAVRFHAGEVHLLVAEGDRRIPWNDLAELHMPAVDPWESWWDQVAALCPTIDIRLLEIETSSGLVATASQARMAARFEGNSAESDRWVHGLQPAWSLDLLWVPFREIYTYRSYLPREVPLTRITPRAIAQRGGLGGRQAVQINRNVLGAALRSKTLDFGGGFGVGGGAELMFDLPLGVRSIRAFVSLDRAAGNGGCIKPRLYLNDTKGAVLWDGPVLIGSETVADTGALALTGPATGQKAIVLQIDPVAIGKPAGADPLDIRDHANWCDPTLELDPAFVQTQLESRLPQRFAAWREWAVSIAGGGTWAEAGLETTFHFDERRPPPGNFPPAVQVKLRPLILRRELVLSPRDHWLIIAATRPLSRGAEPKIEVHIGGEPVAEFAVPERQVDPSDHRPLAVPISGYQRAGAAPVTVEIRQQALPDSAPVTWQAIATVEHLPTLIRVLEEEAQPQPVAAGQTGSALITAAEHYYGAKALAIAPAGQFRLALPAPIRIRERPQWGEARFVRFAVKKPTGGRLAIELETARPRDPPARFDLGKGEPSYGSATRILDNLSKDWVVLTRDLFADFGPLDVSAVVVGTPDNGEAFLDHVYFARGPQDFDQIPTAPSPALVNEKARQELATPIAQRFAPATVRIEYADGRQAAGVLILATGEILTAGHTVIGPNRDCRVTLADGTTVTGRTLGVARDYDLGLVQIVPPGVYPFVTPASPVDLPQNQAYLALVPSPGNEEFRAADPHVVQIRRVFKSIVWTDLETEQWLAGGPLADPSGQLVGIQLAKSQFGGILCSRFQEAWPHLPRVRNGEVFGAWPAGLQPIPGFEVVQEEATLQVKDVTAESAAAKAGLLVSDVLQKIDTLPMIADADVQRLLAQRDAGQEIVVDLLRGGAPVQVKIRLEPRSP